MRLRRFFSLLLILLLAAVFLPFRSVLAQCVGAGGFPDPLCGADVPELVNRFIHFILLFVGALFFVMFVWGGFTYMTAGGEAKKIEGARKTLANAVIGLLIVALSYVIVANVIDAIVAGKGETPAAVNQSAPGNPPAAI